MSKKYNFDADIATYISASQEIERLSALRLEASKRAAKYMKEKGVTKMTTAKGRIVWMNYGLPFKIDKLPKSDYDVIRAWCVENDLMSINYMGLTKALRDGKIPSLSFKFELEPRIRLFGISKRLKKLL